MLTDLERRALDMLDSMEFDLGTELSYGCSQCGVFVRTDVWRDMTYGERRALHGPRCPYIRLLSDLEAARDGTPLTLESLERRVAALEART